MNNLLKTCIRYTVIMKMSDVMGEGVRRVMREGVKVHSSQFMPPALSRRCSLEVGELPHARMHLYRVAS